MSEPPKVGLAEALRQRELDDDERDSSNDNEDWGAGPDSPTKKMAVPTRKLARPGENAPALPSTRPAVTKPQPTGASSAEKRSQSDLKRACDSYEIDLAATEYGMCKCGYKKNEHVQGAAFRAAPRPIGSVYHPETKAPPEKKPVVLAEHPSPARSTQDEPEEEAEGDQSRPCDGFDVDLLAKEFGTCKCGFKKTAHTKAAQLAGPKKAGAGTFSSVQTAEKLANEERKREQDEAKRKSEEDARALHDFQERERKLREMEKESASHVEHVEVSHAAPVAAQVEEPEPEESGPKACDSYEIDMNAKEFGTCKCGFKKTDHSKTSLFSKPLPKPAHVPAPIAVPNVPKISSNRAPPAFATSAPKTVPPPAPKPAEPVHEEEPPAEPEVHAEEPAVEDEPAAEEPAAEGEENVPAPEVFDTPIQYRALFDFDGQEVEDLSFKAGEIIEVYEKLDEDWLRGRTGDRDGVFPVTYVAKLEDDSGSAAAAVEEEAVPEPAADELESAVEETPAVEEPAEEEVPEPVVEETPAAVEEEAPAIVEEPEPVLEEEPAAEPEAVVEAEQEAVEESPAVVEEPEVQEETPVVAEEEEGAAVVAEENEQVPFRASAQFEFNGETADDLSFQPGDEIDVLAIVDVDWWRGSINGRTGIFPAAYVTRLEGSTAPTGEASAPAAASDDVAGSLGVVSALFDMEAQAEGDLPFRQGDQIHVLEIIDEDWYKGSLNGTEGLVPRSYVSELNP